MLHLKLKVGQSVRIGAGTLATVDRFDRDAVIISLQEGATEARMVAFIPAAGLWLTPPEGAVMFRFDGHARGEARIALDAPRSVKIERLDPPGPRNETSL